ncbi:MAG: signal peptide peptidase SppA [Phycisphaerae bacterium]|nr:signal peptide peptidase SppA [Phycisphaerae bacterium]
MNRTMRTVGCWTMLALAGLLLWPAQAQAEKTVLRLRLDGPIMEAPSDAAGLLALLTEKETHTLHDWVTTIRSAAADREIDGLVLIIEFPEMSFAQVEELTQALKAFQAKGKPVYCYLDYAGNLSYALAAAADHITMAENSDLGIIGLHAEMMFLKGLLDKIGVEAELLHCGAYKSFIEPYTRTEPSPEAAENINWLLDGLYDRWVQMIADGRGLSTDEVKKLVDTAPLSAEQALKHKLVDEVSSFPAFKKMVYKEFGKDVNVLKRYEDGEGIELDLNNPFTLLPQLFELLEGGTQPKEPGIGLIYIEGAIMVGPSDESPFGGKTAGSTSLRAALEEARLDDDIRAVVVRVDSPGGSALASDIIWKAATRCGEEKPLIVSMGGVAGSGGYYVAIPADTIFADPTTITGSIGVGGGKLVWKELMEDKLGITTTEFSRGKHAGLMSFNRKWNESEREWITDYMNTVYEQFKGRVIESRGDRLKRELEDVAAGRVYTGEQALELGLVDQLGGLSDALDFAAKKAGLGQDYEIHITPKPSEFAAFINFLQKMAGEDGSDEFEIALSARLRSDPLLRSALPLARELAPQQLTELLRQLHNLMILHREHAACFMPFVPRVR